jgi:hypothetical protein
VKQPTKMDVMDYERPTDEEVAEVVDYWARVGRVVRDRRGDPGPIPSQDLLRRVALHQQWQAAVLCQHPEVRIEIDLLTCAECGRPVRMLSDVQVADLTG